MADAPIVRERVLTALPSFAGRVVAAPFQFPLTAFDELELDYLTIEPSRTLQLDYRILTAQQEMISSKEIITMATDRVNHSLFYALRDGYLLSATIRVTDNLARTCRTFVSASLVRGTTSDRYFLAPLFQGYPGAFEVLGWPGSPLVSSAQGPERLETFVEGNPAVGTDWTVAIPDAVHWRLTMISAVLTTSGVAGNRQPALRIVNGSANVLGVWPVRQAQVASTAVRYSWGLATPHDAGTVVATIADALPDWARLPASFTFGMLTSGLLAGDQWSSIAYAVHEALDVARYV